MGTIRLKKMKFHAYHGCLVHEKMLGNTFFVNLDLVFDTSRAEFSDNILETLNYQLVYDVVKEEMDIASDLIEHVGRRILDRLMERFAELNYVSLEVEKKSPPLGGEVENVSFLLEKNR